MINPRNTQLLVNQRNISNELYVVNSNFRLISVILIDKLNKDRKMEIVGSKLISMRETPHV